LSDYIEFHKKSLKIDSDGIYRVKEGIPTLKLVKKSGGVGDRMNTVVAQFYLAICHHRVFIAHPPRRLDLFLQPRLIQWNAQRDSSPVGTLFIDSFEQKLDNKTIFATNETDIDMFGRNLWHYLDKIKMNHCPRNLTLPQSLYSEYGNISEAKTLYYFLYLCLFDFSNAVKNRTDFIRHNVGMDEREKPYLAAHIRTGDSHFGDVFSSPIHARHSGEDTVSRFFNCSRQIQVRLLKCLGATTSYKPKIYVASDKPETKSKFQQQDPTSIRFMADMEIFHIDRSMRKDFKNFTLAETDVWSELQILTEATCIVYSRSGFSELAAWVGSFPRCAVKFDDCAEDKIKHALANIGCSSEKGIS
jgi:hypothetical protein